MYIKYLKYVMRHKRYVMLECFKRCLFIQGLIHDMSKFMPIEFVSYAQFFCSKGQPENRGFTVQSGNDSLKESRMERGWLHHIHLNKHHWNYWVSVEPGGKLQIFDMPYRYIVEMVCDWEGASKALRGKAASAKEWYESEGKKLILSSRTRRVVERLLRK